MSSTFTEYIKTRNEYNNKVVEHERSRSVVLSLVRQLNSLGVAFDVVLTAAVFDNKELIHFQVTADSEWQHINSLVRVDVEHAV